MQRKFSYLLIISLLVLGACKNADKKQEDHSDGPMAQADSLYNQLLDEHEVGMKDWMKIDGRQKRIKALLDSLATLPNKADAGISELKNKLNDAASTLQKAYEDMDSWMSAMNLDSAKNDLAQRIKYLTEEKLRATQVNEAIMKSIQQADSLLKAKF
jgi:hypothetical protein